MVQKSQLYLQNSQIIEKKDKQSSQSATAHLHHR